eukprot:scaffold135193_cov47-Attheya_sp.AAC.1
MAPRRSTRLTTAARKKEEGPAAAAAAVTKKVLKKQPNKKRAGTAKTNHKKKRKTGLKGTIDASSALGVIDPESKIHGTIEAIDGAPCDVMLVLVDPAKNMDKFFILQLIQRSMDDSSSSSFVVYTRWGRTGTSGQGLEQDFMTREDGIKCFESKFEEKTGLEWERRTDPVGGKKYRFIQQNFGEKQAGYTNAKWQYWVDDGVDGKQPGWYDYTREGSIQAEQLFQEHACNSHLINRVVDSGMWTYDVNLSQMTQTNIKHPNKTCRRIRRCPVGLKMEDSPPAIIVAPAVVSSMPTSPMKTLSSTAAHATPVKSSSAALVTPSSTLGKPPASSKSGSHPVDPDIDRFYSATPSSRFTVTQNEDDEWYDVVLNQCNITGGSNNNKYYRIQMLKMNSSTQHYVWFKWGRVGEPSVGRSLQGPFPSEDAALPCFAKKYRDKTGNKWGSTNFVHKKGKYTPIQIDNDVEVKDEFRTVPVKTEEIEYLPSELDDKTRELMEVLFSQDMRDQALASFNLDLKRLPLGVPSQQQIQIGVSVLNEIEDKLNGGTVSEGFAELSSRFYTAIPHSFGRSRPPVIDTSTSLQTRYDMTNILLDMFSTNEAVRQIEQQQTEIKQLPYPADSHYKTLNAAMSLVDTKSQEYALIQTYFDKTKKSGKLHNVWTVDRRGENERFQKFDNLDNRRLLWHGTNIAVAAKIITSGLRIMPHSGGRVGAGIYLASMQEKSASYTSGYGAKFACMFLCEGALGKAHTVTQDGSHASSLKSAPAGFQSVHAVGKTQPKVWTRTTLDGKTVEIPQDGGMDSGISSSFFHD